MAKEKTVYVCSNCGQESPKWVGKCPSCGEWNTYVEEIVRKEVPNKRPVSGIESPKAKPVTLSEIEADEEPRIDMHDEELNRVLGGGLVPGSLVLIGGEPGIGKSTLVLQTVLHMPEEDTLHLGRRERKATETSCRPVNPNFERLPDCLRNIVGTDLCTYQKYTSGPSNHRLHTDDIDRKHRIVTGKHRASPGVLGIHPPFCQRDAYPGVADRAYQQRRQHCRTEGSRAHRRHRTPIRGRPALYVPYPAQHQEPLWKYR